MTISPGPLAAWTRQIVYPGSKSCAVLAVAHEPPRTDAGAVWISPQCRRVLPGGQSIAG